MKRKKTQRGFTVIEFTDRYGKSCSLQKSSLGTEYAIWLGIDDAEPRILIEGKGWTPVKFPENTLFTTRMHLTQKDVKKLLPLLQKFVETGEI